MSEDMVTMFWVRVSYLTIRDIIVEVKETRKYPNHYIKVGTDTKIPKNICKKIKQIILED